jgi:tRNA-uridine 2-sulfurtransferase
MGSKKVAIAMSGGVDSSVTAHLLKEQGFDIFGVLMDLWGPPGQNNQFSKFQTAKIDAQKVADEIGIPLEILDFKDVFKEKVVENFISTYQSGQTPNPCVICNKKIKFGLLLDYALAKGADYLATGHYTIVNKTENIFSLHKGNDPLKDQSYFLSQLNQTQLSKIFFPLGTYSKDQIREIAKSIGLHVAEKAESQDICFIDDNNYRGFLKQYSKHVIPPGNIVNLKREVLGKHNGLFNYTIGQRRGLGVSFSEPLYVIDINMGRNELVIGTQLERNRSELIADQVNFIDGVFPEKLVDIETKVRYSAKATLADLTKIGNLNYHVHFHAAVKDITPGQSVVFYTGNQLLGGGTIH